MVNPLVTTEMVTPIEREAGVDVVNESEAVEMAEGEDMLISKRFNLLHRSNLPHSTYSSNLTSDAYIMIPYFLRIPNIVLTIPLLPCLYLGLGRKVSILEPGHTSLLVIVVFLPRLHFSSI